MKAHRFLFSLWALLFAVGLPAAAPLPNQSTQLPPRPVLPEVVHVNGSVRSAKLIHAVAPACPLPCKKDRHSRTSDS